MKYNQDLESGFGIEDQNLDPENLHQPDKYHVALSKYNTDLKDDEVAAKTAHIIEKYVKENDTQEVKKIPAPLH